MTIEIQMLAWSIVLGIGYVLLAATAGIKVHGGRWAMSPRDETLPPLAGMAGRLQRAQNNFLETFAFFAAAVLALAALGRSSHLTELGAELYFWSRVLYLPLYAFGVYFIRSLVWFVSLVGIVMLAAGLVRF